jgi:hypothetical protein
MTRWRITIPQWETEVEAEDEGEALVNADLKFDFMSDARAEELEPAQDTEEKA